jgi:hypothetical protein
VDIEQRWEALRPGVVTEYGTDRTDHVAQLLTAMTDLRVRNLDVYLSKLERAPLGSDEFAATLREGVYARDFASQSSVVVTVEPHGARGPDLGVEVDGVPVNVEIKRLTEGDRSRGESLEDWYQDEFDPEARPSSREWVTRKLADVIRAASSQLVEGELNVIILADFSAAVGRQNFIHATEDLAAEIELNRTYGRVNLVQYDANFSGPVNNYLWANARAKVPMPPEVQRFFRARAAARSQQSNDQLARVLGANGRGWSDARYSVQADTCQ